MLELLKTLAVPLAAKVIELLKSCLILSRDHPVFVYNIYRVDCFTVILMSQFAFCKKKSFFLIQNLEKSFKNLKLNLNLNEWFNLLIFTDCNFAFHFKVAFFNFLLVKKTFPFQMEFVLDRWFTSQILVLFLHYFSRNKLTHYLI